MLFSACVWEVSVIMISSVHFWKTFLGLFVCYGLHKFSFIENCCFGTMRTIEPKSKDQFNKATLVCFTLYPWRTKADNIHLLE